MSKQNQDEQVQDGSLLTYYHMTYLHVYVYDIFFFYSTIQPGCLDNKITINIVFVLFRAIVFSYSVGKILELNVMAVCLQV